MEKKYEQFKLKWMLEHGHTLKELIDELEELREESDPDETLQDIFDEWEFGYGFGSEIWPCYEEYLDCEGAAEEKGFLEQELDYIVGFAVESCFDNELACQQLRRPGRHLEGSVRRRGGHGVLERLQQLRPVYVGGSGLRGKI